MNTIIQGGGDLVSYKDNGDVKLKSIHTDSMQCQL